MNAWLLARVFLPFILSGAILAILPIAAVLGAQLPTPYRFWAMFTSYGGIVLGMGAMVGLLLARQSRTRRLTIAGAVVAMLLLVAAYLIGADPFCWRGAEGADGVCAWP